MITRRINPIKTHSKVTIDVPGSKSYTNRALLIASLINKPVKIIKPLDSSDTRTMVECLMNLGIDVIWDKASITVDSSVSDIKTKNVSLNVNQSGTTLRFLLALCTLLPGVQTLHGTKGLNERPIGDMVDALISLGAQITYLQKPGYPPVSVNSSTLTGNKVKINGSQSSQYLSAMLMISPLLPSLSIDVEGKLISRPYVDMTIGIMEHFGVQVKRSAYKQFSITKQKYKAKNYLVEGDYSSAGYFFAIGALNRSTVKIRNLLPDSLQADKKILNYLEAMGSKVTYYKDSVVLQGHGVEALDINMEDCPDQAPTMAVVLAFAKGQSRISGIQSLRVKETERINALETELAKLGITTGSTTDSLTIDGGRLQPAVIDTYNDHRMAMSFAIAGTKVSNIIINNPAVVNKTFPNFWYQLQKFPSIESDTVKNIVLIGMRGSGKSTIAKMLGDTLQRKVIDLDTVLEERVNMTVSEYVTAKGWSNFRKLEKEIVTSIKNMSNKIISTGGGVVLDAENVQALKQNGYLIWLNATSHTLHDRLNDSYKRHPLSDNDDLYQELKQTYIDRRERYEFAADYTIKTDSLSLQETHDTIYSLLKEEII